MLLKDALAETGSVHRELRDLAHGIYPAILAEAGLEVALETLADRAPIPVRVAAIPFDSCGVDVDAAAYITVDEAIRDAAARQATLVGVSVARADDLLSVCVEDDGWPRQNQLVHVADRVGAMAGTISISRPGSSTNRLEARLPCV